jgi:hypothetical protein
LIGLPRWDQVVTQLRIIHNWLMTGIQWMVNWWVLVQLWHMICTILEVPLVSFLSTFNDDHLPSCQMCDGPYVWCYIFIVQNHPPCADWLLDIIHNFVLLCTILFVSLMVGFAFLSSRPRPPPVVFLKLCWILLSHMYAVCVSQRSDSRHDSHASCKMTVQMLFLQSWSRGCRHRCCILGFPCSRGLDSEADGLPFCQNIYGKNNGILSD